MNEYERKYWCEDTKELINKLTQNGFAEHKEKHQVDTYYIVNEQNEAEHQVYLRIRDDKLQNTSSLDYHVVLDDDTTQETEVEISDATKTAKILKQLGQEVVCVVNKKRRTYKNAHTEVTIDDIEELGTFVEVEIHLAEANKAINELDKMCELLNLQEDKRVRGEGYPDLLLKQKTLQPNEYEKLAAQARQEGIQRFVVAAILTHNNKTLLLKRPSDDFMAGLWELPSGKVEGEETLQEALKREVTEETGLEIQQITSYVGSFDYTSGSGKKTRQFSFVATTKNHQPLTLTEHETHEWIQPENLNEYNVSKEVRAQLQQHFS